MSILTKDIISKIVRPIFSKHTINNKLWINNIINNNINNKNINLLDQKGFFGLFHN